MEIETCRIGTPGALDITIKSASEFMGKELAPTWELVGGHKHFTGQHGWCEKYPPLNNEEYTERYLALLRQRYTAHREQWHEWLRQQERVKLACYCADGKFCHRHLAADVLRKVALYLGLIVE
jgi:uncharacterized protein YeaO (DUF488 family)